MNGIFTSGKFARSASAFSLTVLILALALFGVSPALHKLIHADADAVDHNCAITLFAKGQITTSEILVATMGLALLFGGVSLLSETFLFPLANYRFSSSRAPPVAHSSFVG